MDTHVFLKKRPALGFLALLAGLLGLTALALVGLGEKDVGTFERLAAYPLTLWLTGTGWLMFHS